MNFDYQLKGFGVFENGNLIGCLKCTANATHEADLLLGDVIVDRIHDTSIMTIRIKKKIDLTEHEIRDLETYIRSLPTWSKTKHCTVEKEF